MSTVKNIVQKIVTIGVAVVTVLASFAGIVAPLAAQAVDASCPSSVVAGAQVKVGNKPAVYILDNSMHYRYFESGDLYKSWRPDNTYSGIVTISQACFDSLTQPAMPPFHVFWRPGSYVVKYLGADQLYSVQSNGVLAPLTTSAATTLYGANYKVMTIGLSEWPYYSKTGTSLDGTKVAPGMLVSNGGKTWYVADASTIREVTAAGMTGNWFKSAFVHAVTDSMVAGFTVGTQITGMEAALTDRLQQGGVVATPVPTGGNLMVSLAADNPAAGILASNTAFNPVLKFNLTAGAQGATVTGLTLMKSGFVANNGISGVDVIDGQGVRHGNVISSISTDNNVSVLFSSNPITVPAGSTQSITVRVNLASTATSGTLVFSLLNSGAVTSNGTVGGVFPLMGNTFSLQNGSNAIAAVTLDEQSVSGASGTTLNTDPTNEQEVAKFSLAETSSKEDVKIVSWTLYNGGTASDSDLKDVQLVGQDGTVLATAQQISKTVSFNLSATPFILGKGQTKNFTIRAKFVDGPNRTTQFTVYNNYDVVVTGVTTNASVLASAGSTDTSFPIGDTSASYNRVTIGTGSLSFNKDATSPSAAVAPATNGVVLAKWYAKPTGEDMELRKVTLSIVSSTQTLSGSFTLKVNGTSVFSGSPFDYTPTSAITPGAGTTITLSSYAVLPANQNSYITFESNIASGASNGATTTVYLDLTQVKRLITNDLTDPTVNQSAGNTIAVQAGSLKVTNLSTPVAQSVVAGTTNVELANIELNAGSVSSGEDVRVTSLIVSQTTAGTVTDFGNLVMYQKNGDGTLTALSTTASTATGAASTTFTFATPLTVPKAGSVVLVLKGDVLTRTDGNGHTFSVNNSLLNAVGKDTGNAITGSALTGTGAGQAMSIASAGTLTLSLVSGASAAPSNDQIVTVGTTNVPVFAVRFTAQNEPIKITSFKLTASGTLNTTNDILNLKLYKDSDVSSFASASQMSSSSASSNTSTVYTWTAPDNLLPTAIQPNSSVTIYVKADIGNSNSAVLGDSFRFKIQTTADVVAKGASSGATASVSGAPAVTGISYISPFTVAVSADAPSAGSSVTQAVLAGTQLGRVKITNNGGAKVTVTGVKFTDSGSHTGSTTTYKLFYSDQNSTNYTVNTASTTNGSADFSALSTQGTTFTIDGGSYRYVTVAVNTIGSSVSGDTYQMSVASIGDVKFTVDETDLGYDSNNSGTLSGASGTLYADGKPSLGTLIKQ